MRENGPDVSFSPVCIDGDTCTLDHISFILSWPTICAHPVYGTVISPSCIIVYFSVAFIVKQGNYRLILIPSPFFCHFKCQRHLIKTASKPVTAVSCFYVVNLSRDTLLSRIVI